MLSELVPRCIPVMFDNAPDAIAWARAGLPRCALICLDHDLGPNRVRAGTTFDPGTGRDVADALVARPPACPVIVHSTNAAAVPGMLRVLTDAGWTCAAVTPTDDLRWVTTSWRAAVE